MSACKWKDIDAPVLNGKPGSLINVLDSVLVKGYGPRGGACWTKPFSTTHQAVYRNHYSGEIFYLAVDDREGQHALIRGYRSMTSVSAGTQPYRSALAPFGTDGLRVCKSETANPVPRAWVIVADGKGFYLWRHVGLSGWDEFAFGDVDQVCSSTATRRQRELLGADGGPAGVFVVGRAPYTEPVAEGVAQ